MLTVLVNKDTVEIQEGLSICVTVTGKDMETGDKIYVHVDNDFIRSHCPHVDFIRRQPIDIVGIHRKEQNRANFFGRVSLAFPSN